MPNELIPGVDAGTKILPANAEQKNDLRKSIPSQILIILGLIKYIRDSKYCIKNPLPVLKKKCAERNKKKYLRQFKLGKLTSTTKINKSDLVFPE